MENIVIGHHHIAPQHVVCFENWNHSEQREDFRDKPYRARLLLRNGDVHLSTDTV